MTGSTPSDLRALAEQAISASGLTQAEVARQTGMSRPSIAEMVAGRRPITLESLVRLADALDGGDTRADVIARLTRFAASPPSPAEAATPAAPRQAPR